VSTVESAALSLQPLIGRPQSDGDLTDQLLDPIWRTSGLWVVCFVLSLGGVGLFIAAAVYSVVLGPGVWGNNIPVGWAYPIVNFVFWIGIGHAGTFISAFLLLMDQEWRASINRIAEAMTLVALINAGLFPVLHLGRPWFAYWLIPYPATMGVWPEFKSSLPWDIAAVFTYFTVSLIFWFTGLLPDLAAARDRAPTARLRRIYGVFALGWRGSLDEWHHYRILYLLLAGNAAPLVISVHSIVSLDFAIALVPGWHSTIFPPYFVVGAIYSGFAMVLCLMLPIRWYYRLGNVITGAHLDKIGQVTLAMAWMLIYCYAVELFIAWYSADPYERYTFLVFRPFGTYGWVYWLLIFCNLAAPQVLWSPRARKSPAVLFAIGALIVAGMWIERFIIIVASLSHDFLPSSWRTYLPSGVDWALLAGSFGLFACLFLLFLRFVPFVPIAELRKLQRAAARHEP
jgi:Ni/Fe-hydrogenase subunit HybB-like protein